MEITAKLVSHLQGKNGETSKGKWFKDEVIFETLETYPKTVRVTFFGKEPNKIMAVSAGSEVKLFLNLESREYNGKWYDEIKAWKFEVTKGVSIASVEAEIKKGVTVASPEDATFLDSQSDVPF